MKNKNIKEIWVLNGPNLNMLGIREPNIYGNKCYMDYIKEIKEYAKEKKIKVKCLQSNSEGEIVDFIQYAYVKKVDGIIINPGAYTHYSYAIRDALASVFVPKIEIHISDISSREEFRKISVTAPVCDKQIYGRGHSFLTIEDDFFLPT